MGCYRQYSLICQFEAGALLFLNMSYDDNDYGDNNNKMALWFAHY